MAEPVRARRLSEDEGRRLQQIVRRGKHGSVRVRRALIIMASASGTPVPAIARLVAADEDTVRDVIHAFNAKGLHALDPQWAGGRPRLIDDEDIAFIVATATTRPKTLGLPFTRWSVRKLGAYLAGTYQEVQPGRGLQRVPARRVRIGRERLRQILQRNDITFQRTARQPDLEGVHRSGFRRQAGPERARHQLLPGPVLRVRPVRAAVDPPITVRVGLTPARRIGCRRPTGAPTASATSTAATAWPMTSCGAWCVAARAATTPWPHCRASAPPDRTAPRST